MTHVRLLPLILLALAGCGARARTEMVVVIATPAESVLARIDTVRIRVRDITAGVDAYASPPDPLCAVAAPPCHTLPMVLTLVPGPQSPRDEVEVQVTAQRGAQLLIDQSARFTFTEGRRQRLDFSLFEACLGVVHCGPDPLAGACNADGACVRATPVALDRDPPLDGSVPQGG